ncbi:MAG: D-aminoacylase [Deltaproteobacteria bacterium]|uniref:D-aminoacylase n=1 Tax=Candidatus Zymogenus saltonus TaxID=2844893 RepID=A0A9D8KJM7_9DELT|nr:D-aminoacylase [Candidatus Zymogenus saltonus]
METGGVLITGCMVADGTGSEPAPKEILVRRDRIVEVAGSIEAADAEIFRADGLIAAPGFIDIHCHGDFDRMKYPIAYEKLTQGCTLEVVGNCGLSPYPVNETIMMDMVPLITTMVGGTDFTGYSGLGEYYGFLEERGIAINIASFASQGMIRGNVMGMSLDIAGKAERREMESLLGEAMESGALGVSTGLIYPTGAMTKTEELTWLMTRGVEMRGSTGAVPAYATHMRDEGDGIALALDEAFTVVKESNAKLQISHIKCMGEKNWGRAGEVIETVESAIKSGLDVTADVYPYLFSSTFLAMIVLMPGADPDSVFVSNAVRSDGGMWEEVVGRSMTELADMWGVSADEAGRRLIAESPSAFGVGRGMSEEDMVEFLRQPWTMIGSDGIEDKRGKPHPRVTSTFPKILSSYVRERGILTWGEAISKMTGKSADKLGLKKRGYIRKGYFADITLFNPEEIKDNGTFREPNVRPSGIPHVMVNGEWALLNGQVTGELPGRVLRAE